MLKKYYKYLLATGSLTLVATPIILFTNVNKVVNDELENPQKADNTHPYNTTYWKLDNVNQSFATLQELDEYVTSNYIKGITAQIYLDDPLENGLNVTNEQAFFNAISLNSVVPLVVDSTTNAINNYDQGQVYVYKGYDGHIYFSNVTDIASLEKAEAQAKKSWMEVHSAYLFNNIYFATIYDLQTYLRLAYQDGTLKPEANSYQVVLDSILNGQNSKIGYPINFASDATGKFLLPENQVQGNQTSLADLEKLVGNNIKDNSSLMLQFDSSTNPGTNEYVSFDDLISNSLAATELQEKLNYWNIGAQGASSFYVIDNQKDSRGQLFGSYFLESNVDIGQSLGYGSVTEGIMDQDNWSRISPEDAQATLIQNYDLNVEMVGNIIAMAFNILNTQGNLSQNDATLEVSLTALWKMAEEAQKQVKFFDRYQIDLNNLSFIAYLDQISQSNKPYLYLGQSLLNANRTLISGKKYNAFYLLPILRNYAISRLIINGASQQELANVNNVFIALSDIMSWFTNKLLRPLFLDLKGTSLTNGLNLSQIYGFDNHSNSIYKNPEAMLNNTLENGGPQGLLTKMQLIAWNTLVGEISNNIFAITATVNDNSGTLPQLTISTDTKVKLANQIKLWTSDAHFDATYTKQLEGLITNFITKLEQQYAPINQKIVNYNEHYEQYGFFLNYLNLDALLSDGTSSQLIDQYVNFLSEGMQIINLTLTTPYLPRQSGDQFDWYINLPALLINEHPQIMDTFNDSSQLLANIDTTIEEVSEIILMIAEGAKAVAGFFGYAKEAEATYEWVEKILSAVDVIFEIVRFFTKTYNDVFYVYYSPSGEPIIWNGGEEVTQYNQTSPIYDLDDLSLTNPLLISMPHNSINSSSGGDASTFYFNGKFYDSPVFAFYDALRTLISIENSNLTQAERANQLAQIISVLFTDVEIVYYYPFALPGQNKGSYWTWNAASAKANTLATLVNMLIYGGDPYGNKFYSGLTNNPLLVKQNQKWYLNLAKSDYWKSIWKTASGPTSDEITFLEDYIASVTKDLQPIYVLQVPEIQSDNTLVKKPYHLPYPYFDNQNKQIVQEKTLNDLQNLQYVYDPNVKSEFTDQIIKGDEQSIIDTLITSWGLKQFSVPSKKVSLQAALSATSFDDISEIMIVSKVYQARSSTGQIRYYWNLSAALNWLKLPQNLGAQKIDPSLELAQNMAILTFASPIDQRSRKEHNV